MSARQRPIAFTWSLRAEPTSDAPGATIDEER